jgi:hypothetical protein
LESLPLKVRRQHDIAEDIVRESLAGGPVAVPLGLRWHQRTLDCHRRPRADWMDSRITHWSCTGRSPASPPSRRRASVVGRWRPDMVLALRTGGIHKAASPFIVLAAARSSLETRERTMGSSGNALEMQLKGYRCRLERGG